MPNNLPLGAEGVHIPGVGTSFAVGVDLNDPGTVAWVKTEVLEQLGEGVNVIAETPGGDPSRTVVIGAHLDSVPAGPGINDNGSGSGGILEIAEVYAAQDRTPRNKLRFMWYGAEEIGLVGLDEVRREPHPGGEGRHPGDVELRHDRLTELRSVRL